MLHNKIKGFTLIELLVVIAIISLLSTIIIASVGTAREKAKITKTKQELSEISKIIHIAQQETGGTLYKITGSYFSSYSCMQPPTYSTTNPLPDIRYLDENHACRTIYIKNLNKIIEATGGAYSSSSIIFLAKDEWGSPYVLDENQGEGGNCLRPDTIRSVGPDGLFNNSDDITFNLPLTGNCP